MPPKKKDDKEITVEAEVEVTNASGGLTVVRRFDYAWAIAMGWASNEEVLKPINITFLRWVRKED